MATLLMMQLLARMQREGEGNGSAAGAGRAVRQLTSQKNRVFSHPQQIVQEYMHTVRTRLGVEGSDPWQLWQYTPTIQWHHMAGQKRIHHHLSHILGLSLKGRVLESQAYTCQLLKCLHQLAIDKGDWRVALLMLPGEDPCGRPAFAASEGELERIVAYQESLKKLQTRQTGGAKDVDESDPKNDGPPAHGGRRNNNKK